MSSVFSFSEFSQFILARNQVSPEAVARLLAAAGSMKLPFDVIVTELGILSDQDLALALNEFQQNNVPFYDLANGLLSFSAEYAKAKAVLPIFQNDEIVVIAVPSPCDGEATKMYEYFFDRSVRYRYFTRKEILETIERLSTPVDDEVVSVIPQQGLWAADDDVSRLRDVALEAPVINLVSKLLQAAFDELATDIHIEPFTDRLRIRFRKDGVLKDHAVVPKEMASGVTTRIKILSALNIVERRLPQDGRMRLSLRGTEVDFRVSVTPSIHGETLVLRLLKSGNVALDLPGLGFAEEACEQISVLAKASNGLVIFTGPTGSGKTTSLYAMVKMLQKQDIKIFTIEDPVEYRIEGITQLQVNSAVELDFARALRAVLRQDPDVILVGEIRDEETARIAIQAALTGHLVLTTLHTNNAVGAITRLQDMGIEPYLVASTIRGVVAQRLVRKACRECRGKSNESLGDCSHCGGSGLSGRTVVYEILAVGHDTASLINKGASEAAIVAQAAEEGFVSLAECCHRFVAQGLTSQSEIDRVIGGGSWM